MEKLPNEIKLEIFVRLPFLSISLCKFVCKSWHSLLHHIKDDHYFASMHLRRSVENLNHSPVSFFILDGTNSPPEFYFADYCEDNNKYTMEKVKLPFIESTNNREGYYPCWSMTSCNGLVCLSRTSPESYERFYPVYICNPSSQEYVSLPQLDLPRLQGSDDTLSQSTTPMPIGFGYHPTTHEYKVVRLFYCDKRSCLDVYTLGDGDRTWKRKIDIKSAEEAIQYHINDTQGAVLVNGSLHWITGYETTISLHNKIISFDLKDEEFHVMDLPPPARLDIPERSKVEIKDLGGCLTVIQRSETSVVDVDIWVMKDYPKESSSSWVKQHHMEWTHNWLYELYPCMKNDDHLVLLLLSFGSDSIISYDSASKAFTNLGKVTVGMKKACIELIPHIKSFVSLKTLGELAHSYAFATNLKSNTSHHIDSSSSQIALARYFCIG